jgi:hypothetical protein
VRYFACAAAVSTIALSSRTTCRSDAAISPLVPVLRDNMWLTIHVLTIMLGYAAFTLAMGIGHLNPGLLLPPLARGLFKNLALPVPTIQVGTLFLA